MISTGARRRWTLAEKRRFAQPMHCLASAHVQIPLCFLLGEQFRQLGKNGGEPLRFVARKQLATPKATKRLLFEIHVGKGLPVGVLCHKAAIQFLD